MKKIVITLQMEEEMKEAHFRIPVSVCQKLEFNEMKEGIDRMFQQAGIEVIAVELTEEVRHNLNRRWDDPGSTRTPDSRFE